MPSVTEVFGVLLAVMVVFAILGIQLYSDTFGSCSDDSYPTRESCLAAAAAAGAEGPWLPPDSFDLGSRRALKGGHGGDVGDTDFANSTSTTAPWLNPGFGSFDSFGSAMLLLYIMSTGDGWEDVMYQAMDAVGPGVAPQRNDFSPSALFFIAWMFFGAFFALNLFVGTSACSKRPPGQCPSSVPAPMGGLALPRGHAAPQPVATGALELRLPVMFRLEPHRHHMRQLLANQSRDGWRASRLKAPSGCFQGSLPWLAGLAL